MTARPKDSCKVEVDIYHSTYQFGPGEAVGRFAVTEYP